jgi:Family of unknown function (DUF6252)
MPGSRIASLACAALLLAACNVGGPDSPDVSVADPDPANGTMSAKLDGVSWRAVHVEAIHLAGSIEIRAYDSQLELITLQFYEDGARTYTTADTLPARASIVSGVTTLTTWTADTHGGTATIVVTALSATRVAGTFGFSATVRQGGQPPLTRIVTDGRFDISF